jgi:hypothetical protein
MGTAVGAMYSYLENGFEYVSWAWLFVVGLVGSMWLGRNL